VAEAGFAAGRLRPLQAIEARVPHRAQVARSPHGLATTILDPAVISQAAISGLEIPLRLHQLSPTAGGIPLEVPPVAVDLRAHHRNPAPQVPQEASTSLAGIAERELQGRFAAFQARVAKFGKMLPPREMLFPGLNRFPLFTIRSGVHTLRVPGSGRTQRSPRLRALPGGRRSWAIEDFWVA
jgi:hypothetical protein